MLREILVPIGRLSSVRLEMRKLASLQGHPHEAQLRRMHERDGRLQIADLEFEKSDEAANRRAVALLDGLMVRARYLRHARASVYVLWVFRAAPSAARARLFNFRRGCALSVTIRSLSGVVQT
jgi:hypothetical protein